MRAGRKDRRIVIQAMTTAKSTFGTDAETWTAYKEVWAEVTPVVGDEKYGSDQLTSEAFTNFKFNFISGISPKTHRISYDSKIYDIRYVQEVSRREALLITGKVQGL